MTTIATVRPPIQVVWRMSSRRSSPIRRSISSGLMPMRSEPNSPIGTVTSSELTAFVGSRTGRVSWRSRVRFSTRGVPGGQLAFGRARRRRGGDLGLAPFLHHQHAVAVGDLDGLHDLALAQDRVDIGLRFALERHRGEQVAAGALGAAGDLPGQVLRFAPGLEQNAVELAPRERVWKISQEKRAKSLTMKSPRSGEDDPVAPRWGPSGPRKHRKSIAPGGHLRANSMKRQHLGVAWHMSLAASDIFPLGNFCTNLSVTQCE